MAEVEILPCHVRKVNIIMPAFLLPSFFDPHKNTDLEFNTILLHIGYSHENWVWFSIFLRLFPPLPSSFLSNIPYFIYIFVVFWMTGSPYYKALAVLYIRLSLNSLRSLPRAEVCAFYLASKICWWNSLDSFSRHLSPYTDDVTYSGAQHSRCNA